jgi:hypothetical protein
MINIQIVTYTLRQNSRILPTSGKTKQSSFQKETERPVLGRELKNTGSISLFPNSSRRRRRLSLSRKYYTIWRKHDKNTHLVDLQPWRWRRYVPPKRCYLHRSPHGVTTQNNIDTFTAARTSNSLSGLSFENFISHCKAVKYKAHTELFNKSRTYFSCSITNAPMWLGLWHLKSEGNV